jgi:hypothetical protein
MNNHSIVFASLDRQTVGYFPGLVAGNGFILCPLCRGAVQ